MRWVCAFLLVFLAAPLTVAGDADLRAAWEKAEHEVVETLLKRDVGEWARALAKQPLPEDHDALLARMSVLLRAGHHEALEPVLRAVSKLPGIEGSGVSKVPRIASSLAHSEEWELLRVWLEGVPSDTLSWTSTKRLTNHITATQSVQAAEDWLAARARTYSPYWFKALVMFHERRGSLDDFITGLEQAVRTDPRDGAALSQYVEACRRPGKQVDVTWIAEVAKPRLFSHCAMAADARGIRDTAHALVFLERAKDLEITNEDWEVLRAAGYSFPGDWKRLYKAGVKRQIVATHLALGHKEKAQALMEALTEEHPDGLPPPGLAGFAGNTQRATGFRVVEQRIREAEEENESSAKYWLGRARYFTGREDDRAAEEAYKKALALSKQTSIAWPGGEPGRLTVLGRYARWLHDRGKDMLWLYWRELASADPSSRYAAAVADIIVDWSDAVSRVSSDDERLWRVLEAREAWEDRPDERLLLAMAKGRTLDPFWWHAERLTRGTDPSRAYILGRVMAEHRHARAIPVLEDAYARMDRHGRESVAWALFRACLKSYEWRRAQSVWHEAGLGVRPDTVMRGLGDLALAAARAGDKQDAMRLWEQRVNLDRRMPHGLERMVEAGMRAELLAFYAALAKADPQSIHPPRMIDHLRDLD